MKKVISLALLSTTLACAQAGVMGGSEGLHQNNARTLGQWQINAGTGGNISIGSWGLSRGGVYEMDGKRYSFNGADYSQAGNFFISLGLFDFLDIGASLPVYYEHANSNGPSGKANMWTTSRGDLDLFAKIAIPVDTSGFFRLALLMDLYVPTGEENAGVRPRHVWYLNGNPNKFTHPFTANEWAMGAGLAISFDFSKKGAPITWNASASYVYPIDTDETNTLVYSTGVNWMALPWMTPFLEFSGEMRLQSSGQYAYDPFVDPMLITPGLRFHLPHNIEFAIGLDVAVRAFRSFSFKSGFSHNRDLHGGEDYQIIYMGENGYYAKYGYTSVPLFSGSALLSIGIDATTTQKDSDNDGVPNEQDKCARTPKGAKVDAEGCPIDMVADSLSKIDSDNDGIKDNIDKCPNTQAGLAVDSLGCALDFDNDGVPDSKDNCPNTPAGVPVNTTGCPLDSDMDGVPDKLDKCPNTPVGVEVDTTGCMMDGDLDGIPNNKDKCPSTPIGQPVDAEGCLFDEDKDGVPDYLDKCAKSYTGIQVNAEGCPLNKNEDLEQLKKGIQFKNGSSTLAKSSYTILNDVANLMKKVPELNLEIQGHTDNKGAEKKNQKISEKRAQAVVKYLKKKGVKADRLRAVGFGSTMPIADNGDADGRAQNRRVELVPFDK